MFKRLIVTIVAIILGLIAPRYVADLVFHEKPFEVSWYIDLGLRIVVSVAVALLVGLILGRLFKVPLR
jgi:hypothetical protein